MNERLFLIGVVIGLLLVNTIAFAEIPKYISVQGKLTNLNDEPYAGSKSFVFKLFDQKTTGGTKMYEQTTSVNLDNGVFNVLLGPVTSSFDKPYYLEVLVDGTVLTPRVDVTSAGYSYTSTGSAADFNIINNLYIAGKKSCSGKLYTDSDGQVLCGTDATGGGLSCASCNGGILEIPTTANYELRFTGTAGANIQSPGSNMYLLAGPGAILSFGTNNIDSRVTIDTNGNLIVGGGNSYLYTTSIGRSGGQYQEIGYNLEFTGTNDQYKYRVSDTAASMRMGYDGFEFRVAPSGTSGNTISFAEVMRINKNGALTVAGTVNGMKVQPYTLSTTGTVATADLTDYCMDSDGCDITLVDTGSNVNIGHVSFYQNAANYWKVTGTINTAVYSTGGTNGATDWWVVYADTNKCNLYDDKSGSEYDAKKFTLGATGTTCTVIIKD